jgi:hypothetical protein
MIEEEGKIMDEAKELLLGATRGQDSSSIFFKTLSMKLDWKRRHRLQQAL